MLEASRLARLLVSPARSDCSEFGISRLRPPSVSPPPGTGPRDADDDEHAHTGWSVPNRSSPPSGKAVPSSTAAPPTPLQVAAIPLLDPSFVHSERLVLQRVFREKRDFVVQRLKEIGFEVWNPPQATFYVWLDLSALPAPLNSGLVFFEEALKEKVIVV